MVRADCKLTYSKESIPVVRVARRADSRGSTTLSQGQKVTLANHVCPCICMGVLALICLYRGGIVMFCGYLSFLVSFPVGG